MGSTPGNSWAGERGAPDGSTLLPFVEDASNASVPAYGYQPAAAQAPFVSSGFLGEHSAWVARTNGKSMK